MSRQRTARNHNVCGLGAACSRRCPPTTNIIVHQDTTSRTNKKPLVQAKDERRASRGTTLISAETRALRAEDLRRSHSVLNAHRSPLTHWRDNGRTRNELLLVHSFSSQATFGFCCCGGLAAGDPPSLPARAAYSSCSTAVVYELYKPGG